MRGFVILFPALLSGACAGTGSTRPVPPDVVPVTAPPAADPSRLETGEVRASIGFARVLPDSEVVALAVRHALEAYEVRLMVGEAVAVYEVPPGQPPVGAAIADARRIHAERAAQWPCALLARLGAIHETGRGIRPAPGDRDPGARMLLSQIEAARTAPARLRRG